MTQITFDALAQALAPIEELSKGEITFDVNDTPMTLRVMVPEEELEVQRFASIPLSHGEMEGDEEASGASAMEYLERLRLGILSYSLVQVGDKNLRDVKYVETGEVLANGKAVRLERHEALRKLLLRWGGTVRLGMYRKYTELLAQMEERVEKAIEFKPSDLDAEIERVEGVLRQLKLAKKESEDRTKETRSQFSEVIHKAVAVEAEGHDQKRADIDKMRARKAGVNITSEAPASEEAPEPEAPAQPAQPRQPITPQAAPPPTPAASEEPTAPVDAPQAQAPQEAPEAARTPFDNIQDSFIGGDDPEAEVAAANKALLERHLVGGEAPVPEDQPASVLTAHRQATMQRPPHLDAADTREALAGEQEASLAELEALERSQTGEQVGVVDVGDKKAPVFRLPGEELATKAPVPAKEDQPRVNPQRGAGTGNPRFRKPDDPLA